MRCHANYVLLVLLPAAVNGNGSPARCEPPRDRRYSASGGPQLELIDQLQDVQTIDALLHSPSCLLVHCAGVHCAGRWFHSVYIDFTVQRSSNPSP